MTLKNAQWLKACGWTKESILILCRRDDYTVSREDENNVNRAFAGV